MEKKKKKPKGTTQFHGYLECRFRHDVLVLKFGRRGTDIMAVPLSLLNREFRDAAEILKYASATYRKAVTVEIRLVPDSKSH